MVRLLALEPFSIHLLEVELRDFFYIFSKILCKYFFPRVFRSHADKYTYVVIKLL
jgi:hypothetical protein